MSGWVKRGLKAVLPRPIRTVLRMGLHYGQRLFRWGIVLLQVRGKTRKDQSVLYASAIAAVTTSAKDLMLWQDPQVVRGCTVIVDDVGEFELRENCDDLWHVLPWRERSIADLLRRELKPGDIVIDAGANIGVYTVLASKLVGNSGRVIAVEMMPDTADRLQNHVVMNGLTNVTVVRSALSDVTGRRLVATVQEDKYGQATIAEDSPRFGLGRRVEVTTTTLDDVARDAKRIRLMKLDLEGAELSALGGATDLLGKVDMVVYESWGVRRSESHPVDSLLRSAGFELSELDGNNCLATRNG